MIRLRVQELLQERGHTRYWLNKRLGMGYQLFGRMMNGHTTMIRFETIESLCRILECAPGELFEITEEPHHPL